MPFIDLGHTFDSSELPSEAPPEPKVSYPTIFIRHKAGEDAPDFPEGEFWFVGKGRVEGFHKDRDGSGSHDIEFMKMAVVDSEGAMALAKSGYEEDEGDDLFSPDEAKKAFRGSLDEEMNKDQMIGQGS